MKTSRTASSQSPNHLGALLLLLPLKWTDVINDSPDSPEEPKRTHQEPVKGIAGGRTLLETMIRGENTGTMRAAGVRTKWQGNGIEGNPVYIKFLHIA